MSSDDAAGVVLSEGHFRVDRKRALEKMERFQLEDPRRYVLELLAAAAVAGAPRVDVRNDADDFELSFNTDSIAPEDLDALFDHLFGQPRGPRGAMLQHLAMGVLGALGQGPRWVHLDTGDGERALRLDIKDPTQTRHGPLTPAVAGVRVHVRERLGARTLIEAFKTAFAEPHLARLVRGAAARFPARVFINGREVPRPPGPELEVLRWEGALGSRQAGLAVVPKELDRGVDILRHGLVVGHVSLPLGRFSVTGWVRDDALQLNASRSEIVRDELWDACFQALRVAVDGWLRQAALAPVEDPEEELRWTAVTAGQPLKFRATAGELKVALAREAAVDMALRGVDLGPLEAVPLIEDLHHLGYSARTLRALPEPPAFSHELILAPEWTRPVFSAAHVALLKALRPDAEDVTETLRQIAEGRARRQAAVPLPSWFEESTPQRRFQAGSTQGSVSFPAPDQPRGTLTVRWSVGGRVVGTTEEDPRGLHLRGILDDHGFTTDLRFSSVQLDPRRSDATALLRREGRAFLLEQLRSPSPATRRQASHLTVGLILYRMSPCGVDPTGPELRAALQPELFEAPALLLANQEALSIAALLERPSPLFAVDALPPDCPEALLADLVLLPEPLGKALGRALPRHLRPADAELGARISRARRLAMPRRPARVPPGALRRLAIEDADLTGELGWYNTYAPPKSLILREGVLVAELELAWPVPGLSVAVDWREAPVTDAHDALAEGATEQLRARLTPFIHQLALGLWPTSPPAVPKAVQPWLCHADVIQSPPEEALSRTIAHDRAGAPVSLGALRQRAVGRKKGHARIPLVSTDPSPLPGFRDCLVLVAGGRPVVEAWMSQHVRLRDEDLDTARAALARYLTRPAWTEPEALARIPLEVKGGRGHVVLPADPAELGTARVVATWSGRLLATRLRSQEVGAMVVVEGEAFQPNGRLDNVEDSTALTRLIDQARDALPGLIDQALADRRADAPPPRPTAWRRLLACVASSDFRVPDRSALLDRLVDLPLFPTLSGEVLTPRALRAAADADRPIRRVPLDTPGGPTDAALYLLAVPEALEAAAVWLKASLPDGQQELEDWRAAQRRLATAPRRDPTLTGRVLLRRALAPEAVGAHRGELGLVAEGADNPGLHLTPLFDGIALEPVVLPFPVHVTGVVEGEAVRADRALRKLEPVQGPWATLTSALLAEARALLTAACDPSGDAATQGIARCWLLLDPQAPAEARAVPLFPLAGGGHISAREVEARVDAHRALGVVSPEAARGPLPAMQALPVIVSPQESAALGTRAWSLDERLKAAARRAPPKDAPPDAPLRLSLPEVPRARVYVDASLSPEPMAVSLGELVLETLTVTRPLPLRGALQDPPLTARPLLDGLVEEDRARLLRALEGAALQALAGLNTPASRSDPKARALLRRALRNLCPDAAGLREVHQDAGLVGALAQAEVFERSDGLTGSLVGLLSDSTVRAVPPGTSGRALPGASPFWWLDGDERRWLAQVRVVAASEEALRLEDRGAARRGAPPYDRKLPLWPTLSLERSAGERAVGLWLDDAAPSRLAALVDGRLVCELPSPVPGLKGWIAGPFPTSPAFDALTLDAEAEALLREAATALLTLELEQGRELDALRRLAVATGTHTLKRKGLDLGPFKDLPLFKTPDGQPVTPGALAKALQQGTRVHHVSPASTRAAPADLFVLAVALDALPLLESLTGSKALLALDEKLAREERARKEREAREAEKARLAEAASLQAHRRSRVEAVRAHLRRWGDAVGAPFDGEAVLESWSSQEPPPWVMAAPKDAPALAIAAWKAAADSGLSMEDELRLLACLAATLRERARGDT